MHNVIEFPSLDRAREQKILWEKQKIVLTGTSVVESIVKDLQSLPPQKGLILSEEANAILEKIKTTKSNMIVESVAGSGKTTLLVGRANSDHKTILPGVIDYISGSVALVAFGKENANDFSEKLSKRGDKFKHIRSGTAHSFGYSSWKYAIKNPSLVIDAKKKWQMIDEKVRIPQHLSAFCSKLLSLAKQRGVGTYVCPDVLGLTYEEIVSHFGMEYELGNEYSDSSSIDSMIREGIYYTREALIESVDLAREIIDYDDMIYMPIRGRIKMWENDWVLVDEAQDSNPIRRAMYRRMMKLHGRIIFVGDRYQAILGFTGADNDSMDLITKEFCCSQNTLSSTYRCSKSVTLHARNFVPHIQAHESNSWGSVSTVDFKTFLSSTFTPYDGIICRNSKPLVETFFALVRKGVAVRIRGKDLGQGLVSFTNRFKTNSLETLKSSLEKFLAKEVKRVDEAKFESLKDKVDCIVAVVSSMLPGETVTDLRAKIVSMFSNDENKDVPMLTLSTVHKAKGLEWSRVYLLGRNKFMPSAAAKKDWQLKQEIHLIYVAITRAINELVEVEL